MKLTGLPKGCSPNDEIASSGIDKLFIMSAKHKNMFYSSHQLRLLPKLPSVNWLQYLLILTVLISCASCQDTDVIYPKPGAGQQLATKINCKKDESRHFKYNSVTNFWGSVKGQILVNADVNLVCLGDDADGKYGEEALKYLVEVSNVIIQAGQESKEPLRRRKRGIGDFFSNAWQQIKDFFSRMFGGGSTQEQEVPRDNVDDSTFSEKEGEVEGEEEDEEVSDYSPLFAIPFEFVQVANGSIPEIFFSEEDQDGRVRNFKRHLVDAFATQLNLDPKHEVVVETSVMGEHLSTYNITIEETPPVASFALSSFVSTPDSSSETVGESVVVEKLVTDEDILSLAPNSENSALNDQEKIGLKTKQKQVFADGKLMFSRGQSSLLLFHDNVKHVRRKRREDTDDENIMSYLQVHSQHELQFQKRVRRSIDDRTQKQRAQNYVPSSRFAEAEDNSSRQKLEELQKSVGNTSLLVHNFLNNIDKDDPDKLETMFEMVDHEVTLHLDEGPRSLAADVRKILNKENLKDVCLSNFKKCKDLLQLLALAGGNEAEEVLLFFAIEDKLLGPQERQQVIDILSDLSNPSSKILLTLTEFLEKKSFEPELLGAIALTLSNLISKSKTEVEERAMMSLLGILADSYTSEGCKASSLTLDILEAIGNLRNENAVDSVLQISAVCSDRFDIQIATAHSVRHLTSNHKVQQWMRDKIASNQSCDVTLAVISTLLERIQEQEMSHDKENWPRFKFNSIDSLLADQLRLAPPNFQCAVKDTIRYFKRKRNEEAKIIAEEYSAFDSESQDSEKLSRRKREVWNDLNCNEWTEDENKYRPIQNKDEFAEDRATYNKRKSCLAFRKLGVGGASSEISAGMFAGVKEPSDPPQYKLFTKFVSGVNFLGYQVEIGSFYFYLHSGRTKAYVRILGKTRQELSHDGCTPTELKYRPITHIPLYLVSVSVVQLSLGIHLSSRLSLDTNCPQQDVFELMPQTVIRIGGEAMGTVVFMRAAVNIGGNFNYHLNFFFTPMPSMCLRGEHGYDPMSISIEAYYQFWSIRRLGWGKARIWKPSSLSWEIGRGLQRPWFDDTCVLRDTFSDASTTSSGSTSGAYPTPPVEDNDVLVVRA